jgi:hypothetical protein
MPLTTTGMGPVQEIDGRHAQILDRVETWVLWDRHRISSVGACTHLQLDVLAGERDPLDMALDQFSITVRGWLWLGAARLQVVAQCDEDERLDLGRRHLADRAGALDFVLQERLGDVRSPRRHGGAASGGSVTEQRARKPIPALCQSC